MDFLDPNKKRSNRIKLFLGYILVAIAISMGALILLFTASGYRLDKAGNITRNGLVYMSSRPGGAEAYVEGVYNKYKANGKTDTKFELREGRYRLTLIKDGYRSWQREISLEGGTVERIVYPFLFPQNLETSALKTYASSPKVVTSSPDRQWIVVQQPDNFLNFDVLNANEPEKPATTFTVPNGVLTASKSAQELKVVEWSTDNNNFLVKHTFDGQAEFAVINRDKPAESFNVTTATGQKPYEVTMKDKKPDQLYLHMSADGLLQLVDIKTKGLTPIVGRTYAYQPHGDDMLVYVTPNIAKPEVVSVRIKTKDKDYELRELPANTNYVVDVARFDNNWFIAAGAGSENKVYIYKNPVDILADAKPKKGLFARTLRITNPKDVSFSANARMIAAQSDQAFAVYDAETDRQYRYDLPDKIDTERPAEWMDGHRLATSTDKTAYVFDFDGINNQKLMPINPKTNLMFDRDYENSYSLAPAKDDGTAVLTKTKLTVTNR